MWGLLVVIAIVAIFIYMKSESMCGGADQQCKCAGNETFRTRPMGAGYPCMPPQVEGIPRWGPIMDETIDPPAVY